MAECKRACGWRKIGGLYLVGDYAAISCDRIPFPLPVYPVCHSGIKISRNCTEVNPAKLFGMHKNCIDKTRPCWLCQPNEDRPAFLMRVSEKFYPTPADFLEEGLNQGFSKRIAQIPRHFVLGKTVIYLAHINACVVKDTPELQKSFDEIEPKRKLKATRDPKLNPRLIEAEKVKRVMGIFTAFIPQRIEKIYWQSDLDKMSEGEKEALKKRGITPVGVVESKHE